MYRYVKNLCTVFFVKEGKVQMICKNCGAEIDDGLLLCPYCNTENEEVAHEEHKEEINEILDKAEELTTRPERIAAKVNHKISRAACFGAAGFAVLLLLVFIISRILGDTSGDKQEKKVAKLEKFYAAGDYAGMCECLDSMEDAYGALFQKYRSVQRAYRYMDDMESDYKNIKAYREEEVSESVMESRVFLVGLYLGNSRDVLHMVEEAEAEGFRYGESEAMLSFREEVYRLMKEDAAVTEEEIERYMLHLPDNSDEWPELTELAESVLKR